MKMLLRNRAWREHVASDIIINVIMDKDKQTRKKLLESSKREYTEKGYMKASLRSICRDAGLTTGAIYFFFKDKEELFQSVVGEALLALDKAIGTHFGEEEDFSGDVNSITPEDLQDDFKAALEILSVLYRYRDEFLLVMEKASGSGYENMIDRYVEYIYEHYLRLYCRMKGYGSRKKLTAEDRFIVHWMSHDKIEIFIHLLTHCGSEKEAAKQMKNMFNYMVGGWIATMKKEIIS